MKKLTAGIFTVLIGLCAANSADAAIASKAWVEQYAVSGDTYTTDKGTLESSIATAKKAGDDAAAALETYKGTNDAAVQANTNAISAINNGTTGILKQAKDYTDALANGAVATNTSSIATINEQLKSVASTKGLEALTSTVEGHTTAINTLNGTGEGSVSKSIADAVTALKNGEIKDNADAIGALEGLVGSTSVDSQIDTKIDALNLETTYQTIASMATSETGDNTKYPSVGYMLDTINDTKTETGGAIAAANSKITALENSLKEGGDTQKAIAAAQAAADAAQGDADANKAAISEEVTRAKAAEAANAAAAADAKSAADAAQATANAAIPKPTGECLDTKNKCVLTFNGTVYTWEVIERATDEVVQ